MLHLRVFGDTAAMTDVAERLDALPGARHVSVGAGVHDGGYESSVRREC